MQIRSYDDSQGVRRKSSEVVANEVRFLEKPAVSGEREAEKDFESFSGDEMTFNENDVPV